MGFKGHNYATEGEQERCLILSHKHINPKNEYDYY